MGAIFKHAGHRNIRCDLVTDAFSRIWDRLGVCNAVWISTQTHGQPVPLSFLGLHHSPAPFHQSASDGADLFQSKTPFVAVPDHDQEESTKGHAACAEKLIIRSIIS